MKRLLISFSRKFTTQAHSKILDDFSNSGYSVINVNYYGDAQNAPAAVATYEDLPKDNFSSGNRYRAYSRFNWCTKNNEAILDPSNDYFQARSYNSVDGDKVRKFSKISDQFLGNSLVKTMFNKDISIARELKPVEFDSSLEIGLHQIRYKANCNMAAYSSPSWLHRDDEPVVFVHVFNYTSNMVGGDNVIAKIEKNSTEITRVVRISPLQTLLLGKSVLHAVTPMSSFDENFAVRDILLVTFQNKKASPRFEPNNKDSVVVTKAVTSSINNTYASFFVNTAAQVRDFAKSVDLTLLPIQI